MLGDERWAGTYGVSADYIALTHCAVEFISLEEIQVRERRGGDGRMCVRENGEGGGEERQDEKETAREECERDLRSVPWSEGCLSELLSVSE